MFVAENKPKVLLTWDTSTSLREKETFEDRESADKFIAQNSLFESMSNVKLWAIGEVISCLIAYLTQLDIMARIY